ncbi:Os07g0176400 [Oryza sativa Japonica Group]|uniref:Os07g0176400 protein n=1 Tax=Oryza sativa subsp. japonica TaxID=39947 RepID=A0A0P0X2Q6_ORYSJ|nr:hypothetical protein EE612_037447 [Oryza sativa]BAT00289.1 Os07g0176400 [Oryza sativa Japonica Group]
MWPASSLRATSSCSSDRIHAMDSGSVPCSWLLLTSSTVSSPRWPISGGMQDRTPELSTTSSFSVAAILPTLEGMQPLSLMLASTMTDAGELPRLAGSSKSKWLSLRKSASIFLSKIAGGTSPQKLLKRRSTYLTLGRQRMWSGKPPARRLLLTSSSWRRESLGRVSGSAPEKRLELRWSTARSVRRPSSSGRVAARSPWLRSMPATVAAHGSSGAAAQ